MQHMELYKFLTDVLLVISLLYLSARFLRSNDGSLKKARLELENLQTALVGLIDEAARASKSLDTQLLKRKQSLEETLSQIESVEGRVQRSVTKAESEKEELETKLKKIVRKAEDLIEDHKSLRRNIENDIQETKAVQAQTRISKSDNRQESGYEMKQEAPIRLTKQVEKIDERSQTQAASRVVAQYNQVRSTVESIDDAEVVEEDQVKWGNLNIYGEEIIPSQTPTIVAQAQSSTQSIDDIYQAAESLLQAGNDLEMVATRTRLPIEQVRMISTMLSREKADRFERSKQKRAEEEKLGALQGIGIRRQIQTL